jgi:hypothetical protein
VLFRSISGTIGHPLMIFVESFLFLTPPSGFKIAVENRQT